MKSIVFAFIIFIVLPTALSVRSLKIIGGRDAKAHEFPFMAQIILQRKHECGAVILSELFILTAAHCLLFLELTDFFIKVGKHDNSAVEQTEQIRYPAKYITHEGFDYSGPFDIGLIKLDKPLDFTGAVRPITLPKKNVIPSGHGAIIGWGYTNYTLHELPAILQKAIVPILPNDICREASKDLAKYNDTFLCTGPGPFPRSTCKRDSGGPLVQVEQGSRTLIGIVSSGDPHCNPFGRPSVFTRVSAYIDWINKNMK